VSVAVVVSRIGAAKWRLRQNTALSRDAPSPKMGALALAPFSNAKTSCSLAVTEAVVTSVRIPRPCCRIERGSFHFDSRTSDGGSL
jgi:hypothetical protein